MEALPKREIKHWGTVHEVEPMLLDSIHGDGKKWLQFQYIEYRPYYYVARVDSGVNLEDEEMAETINDWIIDEIFEEMTELMPNAQYDEWQDKGYTKETLYFPIPPLEMPCGYWCGETSEADERQIGQNTAI